LARNPGLKQAEAPAPTVQESQDAMDLWDPYDQNGSHLHMPWEAVGEHEHRGWEPPDLWVDVNTRMPVQPKLERDRSYRDAIPVNLRDAILAADNWRCVYCNDGMPSILHIDHVLPMSHGGTTEPGNLVTACAFCNLSKGPRRILWMEEKALAHIAMRPPVIVIKTQRRRRAA
jgi:hypothetical protein